MCLVQQNLESWLPCREHREASDEETEVWRGCQRSGIATDGEFSILDPRGDLGSAQVYLGGHEVLTSAVLPILNRRNSADPRAVLVSAVKSRLQRAGLQLRSSLDNYFRPMQSTESPVVVERGSEIAPEA